ncbi:class I mannose-6-phosphate isomerase [Agromyces sp. Soil535]|uniref:class I mannose-6-phosphate isomerase n=1 Tax=Agromyces sp. Soil535 TaxID=1736390 RepID=UPI0009E95CAA|nr:class I mannose-6-phosphate isomerase [Agromyces sp. Soil535]
MNVVVLPSNRPPKRFYRGGRRITDFRGETPAGEREPEDWVASVTTVAGEPSVGRSTLPDGRLLAEALAADPVGWLGQAHVERWGADPLLLVKLLDAGQRLPVHAHPAGDFAHRHLGRAHGKAEAWYILQGGEVQLGLIRSVGVIELFGLVEQRDADRMLGLLHRVTVSPGDVVYVPPGVLHAIGEGVLLVEVQEPEDLSILVEWAGFELDGPRDGHLGVGYPLALEAVERRARSLEEIARLARPAGAGASVLPAEADRYFRLERAVIDGAVELEPGFAVLVVTDGALTLETAAGELDLPRGTTAVAPHSAGPLRVSGHGDLLACRPPLARGA